MSTYVVPQVLVFQEFTLVPSASVEPLRATIIGPNFQLVKTAEQGALGEYNPAADISYIWPNRDAGTAVDEDWARVFIDDALLQYFYNAASGGDTVKATYCDESISLMSNSVIKNAIRATATNWKTAGMYLRDASLLERDVQIGDSVKVSAVVDTTTYTLWSYVAGFISDKIAGIVGLAVQDPNNASAEADASSSINAAVTWNKVGFATSSVDIDAAVTPPNVPEQGYIDGVEADEYTFDVLQGGDYDEAVIRVTSASGTDDVAAMTLSDWGVASPFGNKELSVTFDQLLITDIFELGMQWELTATFGAVDVDPVADGIFEGPTDTSYVIEVTRGGEFGGTLDPQITVTTTTGIDSSGPHTVTGLDTEIAIGSYGTTVEFVSALGVGQGLYKGDKFYIPVSAPAAGAVRTLVLGHNLSDELLGLDDEGACATAPDLSVTLYIKKDIEVPEERVGFAPLVNWETSDTEITLKDGIISYDATWVNAGGTMLPLPVKGGAAWAYYRGLKQLNSGAVGTISTTSALTELVGVVDSDNPMSMGLFMALLNANGTDVKYGTVATNDLAGYLGVLDKLTIRNDVYSITPLTFDVAVQDAVASRADALSTAEDGRWRRAILASSVSDDTAMVDASDNGGAAVLATIEDDPNTSGTQYTLAEVSSDVDLLALGVVAGDVLRANYTVDGFGNSSYSEYTVDAVLSEGSVRLLSGPTAPVSVAAKVEIWRTLSSSQHAEAIAAVSARFANRRVTNIWPDYFESGAESLEGYYIACAFAGLRSGVAPQRSLTNTALSGIDSVEKTTEGFTEDELNTIANGGTCIVTQSPEGEIYIRHDLTTDMTDINTREEMITANLDSISYFMLEQIAPFIGVSNLIEGTINQINVELEDGISFLRNNSNIPTIGGQLVDGTVTSIERHPTLHDRLVVILSLDLPEPLNNVELHLVV